MSNLQPGRYTARPISYAFGSTDKGVDFAALTFDIPFDGGTSEQITAYLYFATTENSRISIEQIRNCGWHGDDLSADLAADGYGSVDVKLVLAEDSYEKDGETKTSLKVKSIWRADGPAVKNPMTEDKRKAFAAKMKGLALATKPTGAPATNGTAQPRKAAPAQRSYGPHAGEPDPGDPRFGGQDANDDLPFLPNRLGGDGRARRTRCGRDGCSRRRSDTAPRRGRPGPTFLTAIKRGNMATKKTTKKASPKREYVIVRTSGAGVHAGYLAARSKDEVTLTDARRIWRWDTTRDAVKSYTLSDIARTGATGSAGRVSAAVPKIVILGAHEILTCTAEAAKALIAVAPWQ